jgi:hypothetical protein
MKQNTLSGRGGSGGVGVAVAVAVAVAGTAAGGYELLGGVSGLSYTYPVQ